MVVGDRHCSGVADEVVDCRAPEIDFMEFFFDLVDVPVIGRVEAPSYVEGSDFIPCGEDLCFIGVCRRCQQPSQAQIESSR
jgi:arginine deiminase